MNISKKKDSTTRVLFICRRRVDGYENSVGLINSATFVAKELEKNGIDAKVVIVTDGNSVDREVWLYKPTHVVLEALWVTPDKLKVLLLKYPNVFWTVRLHSKAPFLAHEGIAFEWLFGFKKQLDGFTNYSVSVNHLQFTEDLRNVLDMRVDFLPNVYTRTDEPSHFDRNPRVLDIGCFGAIRPMKNILQQAISAIIYGNNNDKVVRFHVNAGRVEQHGESTLKNLRALFMNTKHVLIEHPWMHHHDFLKVVKLMDLGMQVSLSETFNIVIADFVSCGVPVVVSDEITWVSELFHVDPNSSTSIVKGIGTALSWGRFGTWLNQKKLEVFSKESVDTWLKFLECK